MRSLSSALLLVSLIVFGTASGDALARGGGGRGFVFGGRLSGARPTGGIQIGRPFGGGAFGRVGGPVYGIGASPTFGFGARPVFGVGASPVYGISGRPVFGGRGGYGAFAGEAGYGRLGSRGFDGRRGFGGGGEYGGGYSGYASDVTTGFRTRNYPSTIGSADGGGVGGIQASPVQPPAIYVIGRGRKTSASGRYQAGGPVLADSRGARGESGVISSRPQVIRVTGVR